MKKIFSLVLAVLIFTTAFCACKASPGEDLASQVNADENKTYSFKTNESTPPNSYSNYQNAAISFSSKMLSSLLESDDNAVYSPSALYYQLTLLQNAASGSTQNKLKLLTGENITISEINECNGYFFSRLKALSKFKKGYYINISGDMFFNENIPVGQNFLLQNADFYKQGIFRLDFSDKDTAKTIDSYIREKSDNKVSYKKTPEKDSGIALINSAFISDCWLDGYTQKDTSKAVFNGVKGSKTATYLRSTEYYLDGEFCEGFVKDLKNTPAKFVALLPKKLSVKKLSEKLNGSNFLKFMDSMSVFKTCDAYLPVFSDKATFDFAENKELRFLKETGDYSSLSYGAKAKVSDITQSFEFSVSNGGIGNKKIVSSASTKKNPDKTVKLNRPFIFALIDNESNIPVFMGAVSDI